jgi:hypothetical protein
MPTKKRYILHKMSKSKRLLKEKLMPQRKSTDLNTKKDIHNNT